MTMKIHGLTQRLLDRAAHQYTCLDIRVQFSIGAYTGLVGHATTRLLYSRHQAFQL